jgi:hypothetical protein
MKNAKRTAADTIKDLQERIKKEIKQVGAQLANDLAKAAETHGVLLSAFPGLNCWSESQYSQPLDQLGLMSVAAHKEQIAKLIAKMEPVDIATGKPSKKQNRIKGSNPRKTDADFLKAIGSPQAIGQVALALGVTNITASKRLMALKKAGKATSKKDGVKVIYVATRTATKYN